MKSFQDYGREWLDTLVVAISVAMAFRAYFYEPFKIPTGSMQQTLWGYHTTAGTEKSAWDVFPLSLVKWAWSGERVVDWTAPVSGMVRCQPRNDGFATVRIGTYNLWRSDLGKDEYAWQNRREILAASIVENGFDVFAVFKERNELFRVVVAALLVDDEIFRKLFHILAV